MKTFRTRFEVGQDEENAEQRRGDEEQPSREPLTPFPARRANSPRVFLGILGMGCLALIPVLYCTVRVSGTVPLTG